MAMVAARYANPDTAPITAISQTWASAAKAINAPSVPATIAFTTVTNIPVLARTWLAVERRLPMSYEADKPAASS